MNKEYKKELIERLIGKCRENIITKNSEKEHIILMDNKRIEFGGKSVWISELAAKNTIEKFIFGYKAWNLKAKEIWLDLYSTKLYLNRSKQISNNLTKPILDNLKKDVFKFKKEWINKHLRVISLRTYMSFEYNRNREKNG